MNEVFVKGRKEHTCSRCRKPIPKGEIHVKIVNPPWLDYETDVDDTGRTIGVLRAKEERRWATERMHQACFWNEDTHYVSDEAF